MHNKIRWKKQQYMPKPSGCNTLNFSTKIIFVPVTWPSYQITLRDGFSQLFGFSLLVTFFNNFIGSQISFI